MDGSSRPTGCVPGRVPPSSGASDPDRAAARRDHAADSGNAGFAASVAVPPGDTDPLNTVAGRSAAGRALAPYCASIGPSRCAAAAIARHPDQFRIHRQVDSDADTRQSDANTDTELRHGRSRRPQQPQKGDKQVAHFIDSKDFSGRKLSAPARQSPCVIAWPASATGQHERNAETGIAEIEAGRRAYFPPCNR